MNIDIECRGQGPAPSEAACTVVVTGRFHAFECARFREAVSERLEAGIHRFRLDLGEVDFIDSAALAELVWLMKQCRQAGGDMEVVNPSDTVRVILEITKLDQALTVVEKVPQ